MSAAVERTVRRRPAAETRSPSLSITPPPDPSDGPGPSRVQAHPGTHPSAAAPPGHGPGAGLRSASRRALLDAQRLEHGLDHQLADRSGLLRGVAIQAFERLTADLLETAERPASDLPDLAVAYLRFAMGHRAEFRFMFSRELCMPEGVPDPLETASREAESMLRAVVARESGLAEDDPRLEAAVLAAWSQVHGLTTIVLDTPAFKGVDAHTAEQYARMGMAALRNGLRPS